MKLTFADLPPMEMECPECQGKRCWYCFGRGLVLSPFGRAIMELVGRYGRTLPWVEDIEAARAKESEFG